MYSQYCAGEDRRACFMTEGVVMRIDQRKLLWMVTVCVIPVLLWSQQSKTKDKPAPAPPPPAPRPQQPPPHPQTPAPRQQPAPQRPPTPAIQPNGARTSQP